MFISKLSQLLTADNPIRARSREISHSHAIYAVLETTRVAQNDLHFKVVSSPKNKVTSGRHEYSTML